MRKLRQFAADGRSWWQGLPPSDRYRGVVVACVAPLALVMAYEARDRSGEFVASATGVNAGKAEVTHDHLSLRKNPFELRDDGQSEEVPVSPDAELAIELTPVSKPRTPAHMARVLFHDTTPLVLGQSNVNSDSRESDTEDGS